MKYLDNIPEDIISELNIPTAVPLVYELDDNLKPIPHKDAIAPLSGRYLGNQDEIKARILGVKVNPFFSNCSHTHTLTNGRTYCVYLIQIEY